MGKDRKNNETEINITRQQVMSFQRKGEERGEGRRRREQGLRIRWCACSVCWMVILFLGKV